MSFGAIRAGKITYVRKRRILGFSVVSSICNSNIFKLQSGHKPMAALREMADIACKICMQQAPPTCIIFLPFVRQMHVN